MRMDESTLYRGQWRDGRPHGLGVFEVRPAMAVGV